MNSSIASKISDISTSNINLNHNSTTNLLNVNQSNISTSNLIKTLNKNQTVTNLQNINNDLDNFSINASNTILNSKKILLIPKDVKLNEISNKEKDIGKITSSNLGSNPLNTISYKENNFLNKDNTNIPVKIPILGSKNSSTNSTALLNFNNQNLNNNSNLNNSENNITGNFNKNNPNLKDIKKNSNEINNSFSDNKKNDNFTLGLGTYGKGINFNSNYKENSEFSIKKKNQEIIKENYINENNINSNNINNLEEKLENKIQNIVKTSIDSEMLKMKQYIHEEINGLHIDLIRQFEIQNVNINI